MDLKSRIRRLDFLKNQIKAARLDHSRFHDIPIKTTNYFAGVGLKNNPAVDSYLSIIDFENTNKPT